MMFWLTLLFPFFANAQVLSEPLRQASPEFAPFYFKRVDRWFETNVHDFKKSLSVEDASLFDELLASQKSLVEKTSKGVFRGVTFSVRFDLKDTLETSATLVDFSGVLQQRILESARKHGIKNPPAGAKAYGLRWSSKKPLELVSFDGEKLTFSNSTGMTETRSPLKDSEKESREAGCPGVFKDGAVDAIVLKNGSRQLVIAAEQVEGDAYGPAGQALQQKFRRGLNLSPGQVRCTSVHDTEFYYP